MKITIAKDKINLALQAVQNVIGTRSTLPILSNVLLRASGSVLHLTATDLDLTICASVECQVHKEGSSTLPVKRFVDMCREVGGTDLDITVDDSQVATIRSNSSFFKMHGLPAEEFPPVQDLQINHRVSLPQDKLRAMLRRTAYAASADEARYVLNGMFFGLKEHKLTVVATDGRRLALTDEAVEWPDDAQIDFIIPNKAVSEISRLLGTNGQVEIGQADSRVSVTLTGNDAMPVRVISKLVEGSYPNYRQVIPSESRERIALNREEFLFALRRAEVMTSDKSASIKLNFAKNNLTITANTPEVGEARESLAVNYKGDDFTIAFYPKFLMDPLNSLDDDQVFFELIDELSPGLIKINGPFLYVIMPMRSA